MLWTTYFMQLYFTITFIVYSIMVTFIMSQRLISSPSYGYICYDAMRSKTTLIN